jgi:hypothetical protein
MKKSWAFIICCFSVLFHACEKKELGTAFNDSSITQSSVVTAEVVIPCDSVLIMNQIEGTRALDGFSQLQVKAKLFHNGHYKIRCEHYWSTNSLEIHFLENKTFIGTRVYNLSSIDNYIVHQTNSFSSDESYGSDSGKLYIEFKPDSMMVSFCDVLMIGYKKRENRLTGRVAVKREQ